MASSKSLGTLTLDLVAKIGGFTGPMDKAGRSAEKNAKQMAKDFAAVGVAVGAAAAAGATALAALTVASVTSAKEISRFSALAGTGTEDFQRYAVGARMVGIEQDKLADIFKDTNDKVGDFLSTGGGELKDFFEEIAPRVGVTAAQFRNLSGPQALQLFASSLEKANLSQAEMTFYMEGIADEATALLPLLKNNGKGFDELADSAARAGAIMDQETIRAANELSAASMVMEQAARGVSNQIMSELLPSLSGIASGFIQAAGDGESFAVVGEAVGVVLETAAATAVGAYSAMQLFGQSLAGVAFIAAALPDGLDAVKEAARIVGEELDATAQNAAGALDQIVNGTAETSKVSKIAGLLDQSRVAAVSTGAALIKVSDETKKAAEKQAKAIADQISALELEARVVGMTADQQTMFKLAIDGATESQLAQARASLAVVEAHKQQQKQAEDYKGLVAELRTEEEQLTDQMRERLAVLDAMQSVSGDERAGVAERIAGAATADAPEFAGLAPEVGGAFGELSKIDKAEEKLAEWYATQLDQLEAFRSERADLTATWDEEEIALKQEHETAMAQIEDARRMANLAAGEEFFGNMAGAAKAFFGENSKLYKAAFAVEKAYAIGKALINVPKSYSDAFAAVVGIPVVGPILAPIAGVAAATAQVAQAAAIGNVNMTGMAHDGIDSVPQDGTWLLQKGERVTTAETSAKLDRTLDQVSQRGSSTGQGLTVNLIEDKSRAGQSERGRNPDGSEYLNLWAAQIRAGGNDTSDSLEAAYGLKRNAT